MRVKTLLASVPVWVWRVGADVDGGGPRSPGHPEEALLLVPAETSGLHPG